MTQCNILYHITDKLQFPNSADGIHKGMDADVAWHTGPSLQRTSGFGSTFQTGHRQEGSRRKEQALKLISSLPLPASCHSFSFSLSSHFIGFSPSLSFDISPSGLFNFRHIPYLTSLFSVNIFFFY